MKKGLSIVMVIALVASLAGILGGCGKKGDDKDSTAVAAEASTDSELKDFLNDFMDDEEEDSYTYVERTTDEHYEQEYEELTLPKGPVATTKAPKNTTKSNEPETTQAPVRETTTQFMFTSPAQPETTKKAADNKTTTAKGGNTTALQAQTTVPKTNAGGNGGSGGGSAQPQTTQTNNVPAQPQSDTTVMKDPIPDTNVAVGGNGGTVPGQQTRPQVTYLDKYVVDILSGSSYTAQTEMKADGMSLPITYYQDGNNTAVSMKVSKMLASEIELPSLLNLDRISIITKGSGKDTKIYLSWSGGYMEFGQEAGIEELLGEMKADGNIRDLLKVDALKYRGRVNGAGYVAETYSLDQDNVAYTFYFTSAGISRWEVIDMSTGKVIETMVIKLKSGVDNKDVFKLSGKKYTMEEFENMFSGLAQ